jgi:predicted GNAT superfamily acetyltransferase
VTTVEAAVRPGAHDDLDAILAMNNAAVPAVNHLGAADLEHIWTQSSSVTVATVDGNVGGFLILLDGPGCDYDSLNYTWFCQRYERFCYVDRIVVADRNRGMGIGRVLYQHAITRLVVDHPVLCAEVNIRPRNQPSLDFHDAMNFVPVGRQDTEGGKKTVVMLARTLP